MDLDGSASNLDTRSQQENSAGVEFSEQDVSKGELSVSSNTTKLTTQSLSSDSCGAVCDSSYSAIPNDDSNIRCGSSDSHKGSENNPVRKNSGNGNVTASTNSVENADKKTSEDSAETDVENDNSLEDGSLDDLDRLETEKEVEHSEDIDASEDLEDDDHENDGLEDDVEGDRLDYEAEDENLDNDAEDENENVDNDAEDENLDGDAEEPEAIPANGLAGNGQHVLLGPQRRRREARQQRREAVNPASRDRVEIAIPPALADQWREIGFQWGLENDNDIARMLLQHYEDVRAGRPPRPPPDPRCRGCGDRMRPAPCHQCGPNQHHVRFDKEEDKGGGGSSGEGGGGRFSGGGGRSGFCGRCRD